MQAFGAAEGPICIYLHGSPGGPEEAAWFDAAARAAGVRLLAVDRSRIAPDLRGEAYLEALAREIDAAGSDAAVHLLGFSMGGFIAAEVALRLARPPASLHLISAAVPLEPGDLETMAGGAVFRTARDAPGLFAGMTLAQSLFAATAPDLLMRLLFAGVAGDEARRAADPDFRAVLRRLLRASYGPGRTGYLRDLGLYVWSKGVEVSRERGVMWHGGADTWAPAAMAERLARRTGCRIIRFPELAHYGCLFTAVPRILAEIAGSETAGG